MQNGVQFKCLFSFGMCSVAILSVMKVVKMKRNLKISAIYLLLWLWQITSENVKNFTLFWKKLKFKKNFLGSYSKFNRTLFAIAGQTSVYSFSILLHLAARLAYNFGRQKCSQKHRMLEVCDFVFIHSHHGALALIDVDVEMDFFKILS